VDGQLQPTTGMYACAITTTKYNTAVRCVSGQSLSY